MRLHHTARPQLFLPASYEAAATNKGWARAMYKASDTGIVDDDELEAARATMTESQYLPGFECSFVANVPGSVFGKELQAADDKERITSVPYDPRFRVDTYWDLRMHDYTSIWFAQEVGRGEIHVIDYYECRGERLCRTMQACSTTKNICAAAIMARTILRSESWVQENPDEKWLMNWGSPFAPSLEYLWGMASTLSAC